MKNLFDGGAAAELKARVARLEGNAERLWGTMSSAQAVAHCSAALDMAAGAIRPPRELSGRLLGWMIKPLALGNDEPFRRNTPTSRDLVIADERDVDAERAQLCRRIDRFVAGGAAACTSHPHPFFGRLTPQEWAVLMYKHLDHHLRQFGV
jgi:hypothetical protein